MYPLNSIITTSRNPLLSIDKSIYEWESLVMENLKISVYFSDIMPQFQSIHV